jgi:D-glycero-alpha-D-manno-heptose-7-phosphate kinase
MAKRIMVRAPARIDLAGGWTDVPTYCSGISGEVVNIAINHYTKCIMEIDDERKISLSYTTDMPTGSGLGTSGSMNVSLIGTIIGSQYSSEEIAELAYQFEALLGNKGGRQDQWSSALGGINHLTFIDDKVKSKSLKPSTQFSSWIEEKLLLFNSGITHVSGDLHKGVWERYQAGEENVSQALDDIRRAGLNMSEAITNESKSEFIGALRLVMQSVDLLSMELHDPFRQNLNQFVQNGEVLAWKAMGAGSGGVVGILISEDCNRSILIDKLNSMGWTNLDWKIDEEGLCREEITL